MQKTRTLRYTLFLLLFALVLVGLLLKSYPILVLLVIVAIGLGIFGDKVENKPTQPFEKYNAIHHKHDDSHEGDA